ncbi:MAG: MFS transporter, partial [Mycobacteriales bacterium]
MPVPGAQAPDASRARAAGEYLDRARAAAGVADPHAQGERLAAGTGQAVAGRRAAGTGQATAAGFGVLAAACVSALVVNANTSAVTILLPAISADVAAPLTVLQWAVTGYMLVGAAVIVTSGALGDVLGRRRVFLAGLALFVASCVLIALSGSGAGVIAGRMIQGAAGSTLLA